jgi:uncharacterized membrane protein
MAFFATSFTPHYETLSCKNSRKSLYLAAEPHHKQKAPTLPIQPKFRYLKKNKEIPMSEELIKTPAPDQDVTDNDKVWGLLSWIPWFGVILAIIALLVEPQKTRPFIRFHAVQSIGANIIIGAISLVLAFIPLLGCLTPLLGLATIYPALKAYQGDWLELPWLTQFCKGQGWI